MKKENQELINEFDEVMGQTNELTFQSFDELLAPLIDAIAHNYGKDPIKQINGIDDYLTKCTNSIVEALNINLQKLRIRYYNDKSQVLHELASGKITKARAQRRLKDLRKDYEQTAAVINRTASRSIYILNDSFVMIKNIPMVIVQEIAKRLNLTPEEYTKILTDKDFIHKALKNHADSSPDLFSRDELSGILESDPRVPIQVKNIYKNH